MTHAEKMASFISRAGCTDLSDSARLQLKIRVLDALGCAIGALGGTVTQSILAQIEEFGGAGLCTIIGGGRTAPDRAAFYNSALVRYLDFNDSYLAKHETCPHCHKYDKQVQQSKEKVEELKAKLENLKKTKPGAVALRAGEVGTSGRRHLHHDLLPSSSRM